MFDIGITLIDFGLNFYAFRNYTGIFYKEKERELWKQLIALIVYFVFVSYLPIVGILGNLIISTIRNSIYASWRYCGKFYKIFLSSLLFGFLANACEFFLGAVLYFANKNVVPFEEYFILGMLLSKSLLLFVTMFLKKALKPQKDKVINRRQWGILVLLAFSSFLVDGCMYFTYTHSTKQSDGYYAIFVAVLMNVITIIIFKLYEQLTDRAELEMKSAVYQQQVNIYKHQISEREHMMQEVRRLRHDMKNHLILVKEFLEQEKYEDANQYIQGLISNESLSSQSLSKSGNPIIDGLINYKASYIKDRKINCRVDVEMPRDISIPDVNLCIILGNLLDNAIEGTERLIKGDKSISLKILYRRNSLFISIENTYDRETVYEKNSVFKSSKKTADHGLGLSSVERAVEECGGSMVITQEDDLFKVTVLLPDENTEVGG